jgi:hypothetical protein
MKYNFVSQNYISCVIGHKILKEFMPPSAVLNTAEGGIN